MKKLTLDLTMISDEALRTIEEVLLVELATLREQGAEVRHTELMVELRKIEDRLNP